jgi:hypothetical protein
MNTTRSDDSAWYPVSGYIHVPGIWIDDRPPHPNHAVWPRMTEVACQEKLRSGIVVRATREGLITFGFAGTPLDRGLFRSQARARPAFDEGLISLTHGRCEVLTFHSACLAQARGEERDSHGHRATYVTPANLVHFDGRLTQHATSDRAIREAFRLRAIGELRVHLASAVQRIEEGVYPVGIHVFERSLELLEAFYDPDDLQLVRAVNMLVGAADHLDRNEVAEAFFLPCTVVEHLVARYWGRKLGEMSLDLLKQFASRAVVPVDPKRKPTEYNFANKLSVLRTMEAMIPEWEQADNLRVLRNKFVHEMQEVMPSQAQEAVALAMRVLKIVFGMDLRLSASFGYIV